MVLQGIFLTFIAALPLLFQISWSVAALNITLSSGLEHKRRWFGINFNFLFDLIFVRVINFVTLLDLNFNFNVRGCHHRLGQSILHWLELLYGGFAWFCLDWKYLTLINNCRSLWQVRCLVLGCWVSGGLWGFRIFIQVGVRIWEIMKFLGLREIKFGHNVRRSLPPALLLLTSWYLGLNHRAAVEVTISWKREGRVCAIEWRLKVMLGTLSSAKAAIGDRLDRIWGACVGQTEHRLVLTCTSSRLCLCLWLVRDQVCRSLLTNLSAIEREGWVVAVHRLVTTEVAWGCLELSHTVAGWVVSSPNCRLSAR